MSSIFSRLAIGTANFSKEYNGAKVSEDDVKRILDYCICSGIDTLHTSKDYEWDYSKVSSYFRIITKEDGCVSVYELHEIPYGMWTDDIVQVPYSIYDRRFENWMIDAHCEIHVRSIFLRGKILDKFSPHDCIMFCLANPNVDRVIIGVDSLQQLKDNLRLIHRMNAAEIKDEKILDPRNWE